MNIWRHNLDQVSEYWMRREEPDIVRMHCQGSHHNTKGSAHKGHRRWHLSRRRGGYLSLFMEKETSVLCSSNNLATSPPSVKSSRNPPLSLYPPIIPSSTSSTTPHPNPSIPLVTSSRPDRHQRAGNIGILCHRFCSYRFRGKWTIEHEIRCVDILSLWHST